MAELARFDGADAWASLTPVAQGEIGAIALEFAYAIGILDGKIPGLDPLDERSARALDAAGHLLVDELMRAFADHLPELVLAAAGGAPLIPSRLGPVCRVCGCSQSDACGSGPYACAWAEPDLCTACAPEPARRDEEQSRTHHDDRPEGSL
jgi:hypothetical protein